MRVLLVNNHHKIVGGGERYYFDLARLLKKHGHKVAFFSTEDIGNEKSDYKRFFVNKLDFKNRSFSNSLSKFPKIFFNFESRTKIGLLLEDFKPDIVHFQNIYYYISSSVIGPIKKRNIPIVQTVHDYQLISPNMVLFHDGKICEITKKHKFYKAILHRCVKGSYMATLMAVVTLYFQNLISKYRQSIDVFITPSGFMARKLIDYGFRKNQITNIYNFLNEKFTSKKLVYGKGDYVLFFGRLCEPKGLFLLIKAAAKLPHIPFVLAGNFEDKKTQNNAKTLIKSLEAKNIKILKFAKDGVLSRLIESSRFTVLPSLWYENQPYSIMESYAFGKPVVASNIGGIPELVKNGKTGLLFDHRSEHDLALKIKRLWDNPSRIRRMGKFAKNYSTSTFSPEAHYSQIINVYSKIVRK